MRGRVPPGILGDAESEVTFSSGHFFD